MGYSLDLRERISQSWHNGYRPEWIAAEFNVRHSTVRRYITRYKRLGHVRATRQRPRQGRFNAEQLSLLEQQVRDHADATVDEHSQLWNDSQAMPTSRSTLGRALLKIGWTVKKNVGGART